MAMARSKRLLQGLIGLGNHDLIMPCEPLSQEVAVLSVVDQERIRLIRSLLPRQGLLQEPADQAQQVLYRERLDQDSHGRRG